MTGATVSVLIVVVSAVVVAVAVVGLLGLREAR